MIGGTIIKTLKKYFSEVSKQYSIIRSAIVSVIMLMFIISVDILNIPSKIIGYFSDRLAIVWGSGIIAIIVLSFFYYNIADYFKINIINRLDSFAIESVFVCLFGSLGFLKLDGKITYKSSICFAFLIVSFGIFSFRYNKYRRFVSTNKKSNLFDLKDIYNNDFYIDNGQIILLSEKDVDYDLLERDELKNQLINHIENFYSDRSYVIGLIGEWGSGKTTILNVVKKELKTNESIIIIDDFDPWILGSTEALLLTMYEKILQNTGMKFSPSYNKRIINALKNVAIGISSDITNISGFGELTKELINNKTYDEIKSLKEKVSSYLTANGKPVVFIIDNIDRAEPDNIILLFKLIATIFELPNVLYILSFDRERVESVIAQSSILHTRYLEKIIQQYIYIPAVQSEQLSRIYHICTNNILENYGVDPKGNGNYERIIDWVSKNITDLRTYKRLINTAFSSSFCKDVTLDLSTLLIVEIIHFYEPGLYQLVLENKNFFISSDRLLEAELFSESFNEDEFNKKAKEFFDGIVSEYKSELSLLSLIFPYVKHYLLNNQIQTRYGMNNAEFESKIPVYSTKYFDLYFSCGKNDYSKVICIVKNVIRSINTVADKKELNKKICDNLIGIPYEYQQETMEQLELYLSEVDTNKLLFLLLVLWENIWQIENEYGFLTLSAMKRALVIVSRIIKEISIEELNMFCCFISDDYSKVGIISDLLYWLNSNTLLIEQNRIDAVEKVYSEMCEKIISKTIDLYSDQFYHQFNSLGLISYYKDSENKDKILNSFFNSIYSDSKVYRFLGDVVSRGVGKRYIYRITESSIKLLYLERKTIENSFLNNPPKTESERIIKEIFEKSFSQEIDDYEDRNIETDTPIKFVL